MKIDILTLFPEIFESPFKTSIIGKAIDRGLLDINIVNIRDFAKNKHKQADNYPYSGGPGMIMSPQPLFDSIYSVLDKEYCNKIVYFSPQGKVLNQSLVREYSEVDNIILLCGHYEGIDQRVLDKFDCEEISIGDYILTGGELPAIVFIDAISRYIPGVLGSEASLNEESFTRGLLEYPQYTRPRVYEGYEVPSVLLSGNHKEIIKWKHIESLRNTLIKRPDLLENLDLSSEDKKIIQAIKEGKL